MSTTSEDLRYVGVEGAKASNATRQMHKYMDYVSRSATRNESVRKRFLQVQGMLKGPSVIFGSLVVLQVAKEAFAGSSAGSELAITGAEQEDAIDRRSSLSLRARHCCSLLHL
jgi:hypothetical protein